MVSQAEEDATTIPETPEPETLTTLSAWGGNRDGQLGNGTTADSSTPVQVSDLVGVRGAAGGQGHSLALKDDGKVWGWGRYPGNTDSSTPVQVTDPNDPSGYLSGVQAVAARYSHALALKNDGTVWAWGGNDHGELGNGTTAFSSTPVQVTDPNDPSGYLSGVRAIAASGYHSQALKNDGTVWAWGANFYGQLGNGTTTNSSTPVQVSGLDGIEAIAAGAGESHSLALRNDGTVWAWGSNAVAARRRISGQLGREDITESSTPVEVGNLDGVEAIAAGYCHSLALKDDGTVWAWGLNLMGVLGTGTTYEHSSTPVQVSEVGGIETIAAGDVHSLALKNDGTVWAWGGNRDGQLGNGTTADSSTPVQVSDLGGVKAIAAGQSHSLAVQ